MPDDNSAGETARATEPRKRLLLDPNLADGQHWTVHDKPDDALMEILQLWLDQAPSPRSDSTSRVGEAITIKIVAMTDLEVERLTDT